MNRQFDQPHPYPGKLIIVEGIDGSGKSTQLQLLHRWLEGMDRRVFFTEWNSSRLVNDAIKRDAVVHVYPTGCITVDMKGEALAPVAWVSLLKLTIGGAAALPMVAQSTGSAQLPLQTEMHASCHV